MQTDVPSAAPTPAPPPPPEVDRAQLVGALRELEAAKGRVERDARAVSDDMRRKLVMELLPVLDNLERTIAAAEASGDAPAVVEGIRRVRGQLEVVLRGYGVERIDGAGRAFDPKLHDAITTVAVRSPAGHHMVIDQIAPGYRFAGALLRPAQVVVGRYAGY